jgi:DNA repair exonuclease SbcCD ATPase subunit
MDNFKSFAGHHRIDLHRAPGLYFIQGRNRKEPRLESNGAGKSSLWDAIFWCLENRTIRDRRPAGAVENRDEKGPCSVALKFARDDRIYKITRTRRPNRLTIERRGQVRDIEQREVAPLLGLSGEALRRTLIVGQFGEMFLDLGPDEQARTFTEILNLDLWIAAGERAKGKGLSWKKTLDTKVVDATRIRGQLDELQAQVTRAQARADSWADEKRKRRDGLQERRDTLLGEIAAAERRASAGNPEPVPTDDEVKRIEETIDAFKDNRAKVEADRLYELRMASEKRALITHFLNQVKAYDSAGDQCPTCGQNVSKKHIQRKRDEALKVIEDLTRDEGEMEGRASLHGNEIAKIDQKIREREQALREVHDLLRTRYREDDEKARAVERWRTQLEVVDDEIRRLDGETNLYLVELDDLQKREASLSAALRDREAEIGDFEWGVKACAYWVDTFREIRVGLLDEALRELEWSSNRHMVSLGLTDWDIRFATERMTAAGDARIAFTTTVYPPGAPDGIKWESYSGGESQRIQLAVSFGLSEVLLARAGLTPNLEVLDEPIVHLSRAGIDDLLHRLRERAHDLHRAIYYVDQFSYDSGWFDGTLIVEKDERGSYVLAP